MNEHTIRQAAERYFSLISGDAASYADQLAPLVRLEDADGMIYNGRDSVIMYNAAWISAYQSIKFTVDRITISHDQAALRWKAKGVTCTGHRAVFGGITILRFDPAGRIRAIRQYQTQVLAQSA